MIKYWPNQQNINLNNAIVELFVNTEKKLNFNLSNQTKNDLYIDILSEATKYRLLKIIIDEFKKLVLELIELNLNKNYLKKINKKVLVIFIKKVSYNFLLDHEYKEQNHKIDDLEEECNEIMEYLLTYFISGSSKINKRTFLFDPTYTPYNHVQILFESFIIQVSNNIIRIIISRSRNLQEINDFLKTDYKCSPLYTSSRSAVLLINNLKLQHLISSYIYDTKCLYNERQKVWLISSKGIICKYIYKSKLEKVEQLNQLQVTFLLWLEIKDIIIPKVEKILIQTGKYFIYLLVNLFSNIVIIFIKSVIFYLNR
uniref:Uncharacterized protein n=1 Tax=Alsidium seaforthii TaxID=2007182 RepID=A0A1Z1MCN0_9FLOR|nr:hypothetical protein [Bryothamnion seaforthii]ARW63847.1 hypothetical protein [Bryothamnion seaforthii]